MLWLAELSGAQLPLVLLQMSTAPGQVAPDGAHGRTGGCKPGPQLSSLLWFWPGCSRATSSSPSMSAPSRDPAVPYQTPLTPRSCSSQLSGRDQLVIGQGALWQGAGSQRG